MSAKSRPEESQFLQAARTFDEELERFAGATQAVQRGPLNSAKALERAAQLLTTVADAEEKLRLASQGLSRAIARSHEDQMSQAQAVSERAATIAARTAEFQRLIERYGELGNAAATLNGDLLEIVRKKKESEASGGGIDIEISALRDKLTTLADSAQQLLDASRAADFEDITRQADSIRQQLLAARNKLSNFSRNAN